MKKSKTFFIILLLAIMLIANIFCISQGSGGQPGGSVVRNMVLAFFYMLYLGLGKWMNPGILILAGILFCAGLKKSTWKSKEWLFCTASAILVFYLTLLTWLGKMGGLVFTDEEVLFRLEYYVFFLYEAYCLGTVIRREPSRIMEGDKDRVQAEDKRLLQGISLGSWLVLVIGLIPLLAACQYIFPQGDDWSLGYKTHIAFQETGSFIAALGGALSRVWDALIEHTGTYFTLLLMSLHPGVFKESWYAVTPFIFVGLILFSTWFFFREICFKWLKLNRGIYLSLTALYCILVIQCMPTKASAFYWFNGAVNYILPHSLFLCLLVFTLRLYRKERSWYNYLGAALTGICASGGNLVTVVGGVTVFIELYFLMTVFKKWKKQRVLLLPGGMFFLGFLVNIAAPGNSRRVSNYVSGGLVNSFIQAFELSLKHMLGEWVHWSLFLFLILAIPLLWKIAERIEISWRFPLLFFLLGWGNLAGMFFAPLYATGQVDAGRFLNIMYMTWILWLMADLTYLFGWIQQKYQCQTLIPNPKKYYAVALGLGIVCLIPAVMAETEYYTASFAARTILSGEAEEYALVYRKNIEILNSSTDKEVTLYELENEPPLFTNSNIEVWHSGIRSFYQKEKLNFIPWGE